MFLAPHRYEREITIRAHAIGEREKNCGTRECDFSEKRVSDVGGEEADRAGATQLGDTRPTAGLLVLLAHQHVRLLRIVIEFRGVRRR